ncbi:MAG TPA: zinc-binding dehydrogenase [Solirubrobacteraceae bacterium]|nr:zinc-binding dehydrogenase [Solirubrobacteraceae bacterium]
MSVATEARFANGATFRGAGAPLAVEPVELDEPRGGDVVVRVSYAGVCGTDVHILDGHLPVPEPLVPGHEGLGLIEAAGPEARLTDGSPAIVGQRVMWASSISCGRCWQCRVGREPTLCSRRRTYGVNRTGSWSGRMHLEAGTQIFPVPAEVPCLAAMSLGCAGPTMLHAFDERRAVRRGETVVVQGSGPVGLAAALYAQASGAARVILLGAPAERLELAAEAGIGTDRILIAGAAEEDVVAAAVAKTPGGRGADLVIECTGVPSAIDSGLRLCRRGGTYLVIGQYTDAGPALINPHAIVQRQLTIKGSWAFTGVHVESYLRSLPAVLERHDLARLVTVFDLESVNDAIAAVRAGRVMKAVLEPNGLESEHTFV